MIKRAMGWFLCGVPAVLFVLAAREVYGADSSVSPAVSPSPSNARRAVTPTPSGGGGGRDPLEQHLGLIIGVPVGLGICILFGIGCFIWLGVSAYREYRANRPSSSYHGTASTRVQTGGGSDTLPRTAPTAPSSSYYSDSRVEDSLAVDPAEATSTM